MYLLLAKLVLLKSATSPQVSCSASETTKFEEGLGSAAAVAKVLQAPLAPTPYVLLQQMPLNSLTLGCLQMAGLVEDALWLLAVSMAGNVGSPQLVMGTGAVYQLSLWRAQSFFTSVLGTCSCVWRWYLC